MTRMRHGWVIGAIVAMTAALGASADQSFGAGVKVTPATEIQKLYETPEAFVGKTVRVDGVVTAVCEEMGCWMALAASKDSERVVRFKVEHDGAIVFPLSARGKQASAEGVFMKIAATDTHSLDAAHEHAQAQAHGQAHAQAHAQPQSHPEGHGQLSAETFGKTYQIMVTGAVVK
jgi:hypothetical protein